MGRWIRGGGWYPDRQLRLYRKSRGRWLGPHIHESVKMDEGARVEILAGDLLHYTTDNPVEHKRMIEERYAPLGARKVMMSSGFSFAGEIVSPTTTAPVPIAGSIDPE